MTTQKPDIEKQLARMSDDAWDLERDLMDTSNYTEEADPETTEEDSSPPWQKPQLITKALTPTDKQIFPEDVIA